MAVVFSDSFVGSASTALDARVATGGTWSCSGSLPADVTGWKIDAANRAQVQSANGCLARADAGVADHYAKATISTTTTAVAVAVRAIDWKTFIGLRANGATKIEVFKRINAVETVLPFIPVGTLTLPFTLELRMAGTNAYAFLNGASIGLPNGFAFNQAADSVFAGVAKVGLWGKSTTALDPAATAFEGGTLANTLTVARGRSLTRDKGVGVMAQAAGTLAVAGGRGLTRDKGVGIGIAFTLVPAGGRSQGRGMAAGATIAFGLSVSGGRGMTRSAAARVGTGLSLTVASSRSPGRGAPVVVGLFQPGVVTGVSAEVRTVPVVER